ncbi:erythroid differentiation-related factor 1 [Coccinella septempunctata]|uniref:erythroid differentiation-related factor 1 n=1 Tax=Coccinella septempunctata TaxID=41139 RepID=UPI001D074E47|nr:erythroid differentiation-related factor 1 [Coccinella septempunctata]XP_044761247.1 erythroid differentiation-related factor 1 [Coccinella septempunctata]
MKVSKRKGKRKRNQNVGTSKTVTENEDNISKNKKDEQNKKVDLNGKDKTNEKHEQNEKDELNEKDEQNEKHEQNQEDKQSEKPEQREKDERVEIKPTEENAQQSESVGNMENAEIKSRAVVKYSVPRPPEYVKLQCNTNLNLPPAHWLSSSADSYGLQKAFTLTHKGFASFRMAQLYPDCVGDVDVISDAENIKKLLKIPYTKDVVSMFVHRVGNTLLIDNFDIYKNFTRTDGLFLWLRDFVLKNLSTKALQNERRLYAQDRSREALKHRSLISKFMYHSLDMKQSERMIENEVNQTHGSRSVEYPVLPNPSPDVEAPDSSFDDKYNRNVVWTFEDIEMLLGTDMPIFGGGEYPCISLRLRDMKQPINILTGIDYWLDNLMSNVPEVVMCYHLNGFVQKYELIKTEDLPQLKNSKFSPQIIKDVAQNILSFLKTNATKAGHTYWLFKDKEEDVIKLYDLTCLVPQNDKLQNPFTIPVAMLLYRVARNFMKSKRKKTGVIKMLLENCILLLPEDKYPEIVTSSYFMLSEIYLPITTNPEAPKFDNEDQDQDPFESDDEDPNEEAIKFLDLEFTKAKEHKNSFKPPPPIEGGADYRCLKALSNIQRGLNCLQYFSDETTEPVPMGGGMPAARSSEPIPMGYEKLNGDKKDTVSGAIENVNQADEKNKDKNKTNDLNDDNESLPNKNDKTNHKDASADKGVVKKASKSRKKKAKKQEPSEPTLLVVNNKKTEPLPTWKEKNTRQDGMSWKTHLKILLYEKAVLVFGTLSEYYFGNDQYDICFRNLRLLARCSLIMRKLRGSIQFNEDCLLGRAGDCCIRIYLKSQEPGNDLRVFAENISTHTVKEAEMLKQIVNDEEPNGGTVRTPNLMCVYDCDFSNPEGVLNGAVLCYEEALKVCETENMLKRLGNSLNEAGAYFLHYAKRFQGREIGEWAKKGEVYLLKALKVFEKIGDKENVALLNTNLAHMYRVLAYSYYSPGRPLISEERACYAKCNEYFKKALKILGKRDTNPIIWDSINWELSLSLYSEACAMQENLSIDAANMAKHRYKILSAWKMAWDSCENIKDHGKYQQCRQRMNVIKSKMAELHHKIFLESNDRVEQEKMYSLAIRDYTWLAEYYLEIRRPAPYFRVQLKLFRLHEVSSERATQLRQVMESLYECVRLSCEMNDMIRLILNGEAKIVPEDLSMVHTDGEDKLSFPLLLELFMSKVQHVMKKVLKVYAMDKLPRHGLIKLYKECYRVSLSFSTDLTEQNTLVKIYEGLERIKTLLETENFE